MRVVLQRVSRASVRVDNRVVGEIGRGLMLLVGFTTDDGDEILSWMADKVVGLRVFPDDVGRMNCDLLDAGGGLLVVSQFTLYGDARKGRRPSYTRAAPTEQAESLYDRFVTMLRERCRDVETGDFGAMMAVDLVNDGPVTLVLER